MCDIDKELDHGCATDLLFARRVDLKRRLHNIKAKEAADSIQ